MQSKQALLARAVALVFVLAATPALAVTEGEGPPPKIAESYKLPISPPRDQGESGLCWAFATLSMLESNYMQAHPGAKIELSRGALQRQSIADRMRRFLDGGPAYFEDGGVAVDAVSLIRDGGLVAAPDFHDYVAADPVFSTLTQRLQNVAGTPARRKALDAALAANLGPAPAKTHLDGRTLTPAELGKAVLGDRAWSEYDLAPDGVARDAPSEDPDARPGVRVHYAPLTTLVDLIHASLKRGEAVVWGSNDNHALLIFGADYDSGGRPIAYWIKDSFEPYVYRAEAATIHKQLTDVTVAVRPDSATPTVQEKPNTEARTTATAKSPATTY